MFTTAGAARSTASAYEFTTWGAVATSGAAVAAGVGATGAARGGAAAGAIGRDAGARRATSSGRTITAMNAAARPITADRVTKVTIRKTGRIYFPHWPRHLARFR